MPFISKDWRGPGEDWIKSQDGWEIKKFVVNDGGKAQDSRGVVKRRRTKTEGDVVAVQEKPFSPRYGKGCTFQLLVLQLQNHEFFAMCWQMKINSPINSRV